MNPNDREATIQQIRHRPFLNALRKAGLMATVSARALISRLPMDGSSAQEGIKPQRRSESCRVPVSGLSLTAATCWVGGDVVSGLEVGSVDQAECLDDCIGRSSEGETTTHG